MKRTGRDHGAAFKAQVAFAAFKRIGRKWVRTVMVRRGIDALYRKPNTASDFLRIGCICIC